jgi:hypothetical protein
LELELEVLARSDVEPASHFLRLAYLGSSSVSATAAAAAVVVVVVALELSLFPGNLSAITSAAGSSLDLMSCCDVQALCRVDLRVP